MKLILDIKQYLVLYDFTFVNDSIAQTKVFSYALLPKSVSATVQETLDCGCCERLLRLRSTICGTAATAVFPFSVATVNCTTVLTVLRPCGTSGVNDMANMAVTVNQMNTIMEA